MTYSVRNIAIAVVMALAAAAAVLIYTSSYRQSVEHSQTRVSVLVAVRDIPAGTPAAAAAASMALKPVLVADEVPGALQSTTGLGATVATQTIYAGQQVINASFQQASTQALALQLSKNMRAVEVNANAADGMLDVLRPGDHIDIFATFHVNTDAPHLEANGQRWFARRLLTDVKVLAVPAAAKASGGLGGGANSGPQQVTLEVSQADVTKLVFAESAGISSNGSSGGGVELWYVMRPTDSQAADMPVTIETFESMIAGANELPNAPSAAEIQSKILNPNPKLGG